MKGESWEPRIANLEKHYQDIVPRIVTLEERAAIWAKILGFGVLLLVAVIGWGAGQIYILNGSVNKLGGQVSSFTPKALSDLFKTATDDKEIIARNAQLAAALVSSARQSSVRSNKKELALSSVQLSQLVTKHSDVPELWQASAQVASYRSELENTVSSPLPDCKDTTPIQKSNWAELLANRSDYPETKITPYICANCKQDVNDLEALLRKNTRMEVPPQAGHPSVLMTPPYIFQSALIIYNGDSILPDSVLEFRNCVFRLELKQEPVSRVQQLILALLNSDLKDVTLPES